MPVTAVIGGHWGDEGKGKIVDLLAEKAIMVVRFSGGDNAGHTVINHYGEFRLHLVPSGIFYSKTTCVIGNGVVINPAVLLQELEELKRRGVESGRLYISDRAHLIMPYHILLDRLEEQKRGKNALGTTGKGIGPAFTDKIGRLGIRAGDLLDRETFRARLSSILETKNTILTKVYGAEPLSLEEVHRQYSEFGEALRPYLRATDQLVQETVLAGKGTVLLEGAQGTLLDPDFGTYPYVTSSSPLAGGGCTGSGLNPKQIDRILGVFKAYTTRVGSGPMPTELKDETGNRIRERAHEYGATTGRPRRCGWFDAVAGRFSARLNGFTGVALTRLDVFDVFPSLKICTGYKVDGNTLDHFPSSAALLDRCQPVYEELPGWETPIGDIRELGKLPAQARRYIDKLAELISCPIDIISVGARREQTIVVKPAG